MLKLLQPEFEHADSRRTLRQILTANIAQVNTYQVTKGAILGNHFHKETREFFYIMKGTFLVILRKLTGESTSQVVNKGTFFVVEPNNVHLVEALTNGEIMTMLTRAYTPESTDTYKA